MRRNDKVFILISQELCHLLKRKNIIENIKETNQAINPQGSWQRGTADQNAHQQVGVAIEPTQLASLV
jgi:hypothetical protein